MRRAIAMHDSSMAARLACLERRRDAGQDVTDEARRLALHHDRMTRHFQHERLIHLLVTLFFAGLLLALMAAWAVLALSPLDAADTVWLATASAVACLVVGVLEAFYIAHYYHLENGVQRLYRFDQPLAGLADPDALRHATQPGRIRELGANQLGGAGQLGRSGL
jgi:hypothetical protein